MFRPGWVTLLGKIVAVVTTLFSVSVVFLMYYHVRVFRKSWIELFGTGSSSM